MESRQERQLSVALMNVNDARSTADLVYRLNCLRQLILQYIDKSNLNDIERDHHLSAPSIKTSDEDKALIRKKSRLLSCLLELVELYDHYEVLMEISTSLAVLFRYFYPIKIPNANEAVPIIELERISLILPMLVSPHESLTINCLKILEAIASNVSEINFQSAMIQNLIKAVHLNKSIEFLQMTASVTYILATSRYFTWEAFSYNLLHITGILIQSDDVQVLQYTIKTLINLLALRHEPIFARLHNHITLPRIFEVFTSGSPRLYEPALQLLNRLVMVEHSHSVLTIGIKLIPSMKGMIQNYKKLSITNLESILLILTNLILTDRILLQKIIDEDVVLDVINCVKQMPSLSWSLTDISRNAIYSGTKEQTQKLDAIFKDHDDLPCMKELRLALRYL
ncbi:hypothetical protein TrispH2_002534 [Trichoplax sp. H2]|nr:hypothetical protein TrispH2_002534 [Trichoplax sp. H2]|eukprot:RDD45213.1 hypothetical protein TrispH2_002534 [Trichoplax sp. H2]